MQDKEKVRREMKIMNRRRNKTLQMNKILSRKTAEKRRKRGKRKMTRWRTRRKEGYRKKIIRNRRNRMRN